MSQNTLKHFIPGVLKKVGFNNENFELMAIVEKKLSHIGKTAELVGVKNGLIYVELGSSAEFQEARFKKNEILKAISQALGDDGSGKYDIRFSLKGAAQSMPKWIRVNPTSPKIQKYPARKFSTRSKVTD